MGVTVRTLTEHRLPDGGLLPERSRGMVVGFAGPRLVVTFDVEGEEVALVLEPWNVYRETAHSGREGA